MFNYDHPYQSLDWSNLSLDLTDRSVIARCLTMTTHIGVPLGLSSQLPHLHGESL